MARAFNPLDTARIVRAQAHGIALDAASAALADRSPAGRALAGWLGWPGAQGLTLLDDGMTARAGDGFVQLRRPRGGREAVLTFAAPDLHAGHGAALRWLRLLGDAAVVLGRAGVERITCAHDSGDALVWQVLLQAGFTPNGRDVVLCCAPAAAPGSRRLRAVRDARGRLAGGLHVILGRRALWVDIVRAPDLAAGDAVAAALAEAWRLRPGQPLWTAVPMTDPALAAAWRAAGAATVVERQLAARPTGRQRVAPRWRTAQQAVPQARSNPLTQARRGAARARPRVHSLPGEGT